METDYPAGTVSAIRGNVLKRVSWGAIFAGVVVSMVIMLALGMLGMGIGLGVVDPTEPNALAGVGIGTGIWFGLSTLIALFAGGWAAGKLAGYPRKMIGSLHGVVVWGLASLFSFYLMTTTFGMLLSGVGGVLGRGLSAVASGAQGAAPQLAQIAKEQLGDLGISPAGIKTEAQQFMQQATGPQGEQLRESLKRYLANPNQPGSAQDRQSAINALAANQNISRQQAATRVDQMTNAYYEAQRQLQQAKGAVAQTSETVMNTISTAAIWGFIAMIIGAIAAALGGMVGTPRQIEEIPVG